MTKKTNNPQTKRDDFSFGSPAWNEYYHGRNKDKKKPGKPKKTAAQKRKEQATSDDQMNAYHEQQARKESQRNARILGTSGQAHAVKIARRDLMPFTFHDVDAFFEAGWDVTGAGTVAAKVRNPSPLGSDGQARAMVLLGPVDRDTLRSLESKGYDLYPAPRKLREGIRRNPAPTAEKRVYELVKRTTDAGQGWNTLEIGNKLGLTLREADTALDALVKKGLIHAAGKDLFGPVWAAGTLQPGLFENPSRRGKKAEKKARAWYRLDSLVTESKPVKIDPNTELVEIGKIVAIEYESNKFDGRKRIYRHDVTKDRALHISTDGELMVIKPGFKVTTRGIEG